MFQHTSKHKIDSIITVILIKVCLPHHPLNYVKDLFLPESTGMICLAPGQLMNQCLGEKNKFVSH
jgi:hypothetical protein